MKMMRDSTMAALRGIPRPSRLARLGWVPLGLVIALLWSFADRATAQLEPSVLYIFPAGGRRGTTVPVRVGGVFLHRGCAFEMTGEGLKGSDRIEETKTIRFKKRIVPQTYFPQETTFPRDYAGEVEIAADAPVSKGYWRVWTSQGASSAMSFIVGDLPEVVEEEIAGEPIPERVSLPVTINGRIYPREDIDIWTFEARAGETVTCEVNASRLGSTLDSYIEVRDAQGQRLAESSQHFGADGFLRFVPPEDGTYAVHISDIRFGGLQSSVYRLTVTADAYVDIPYPLGAQLGSTTSFQLVGQSLPEETVQVALPLLAPRDRAQRFDVGGFWSNGVMLELSELEETLEQEPNDDPASARSFNPSQVLNGRIDRPGDIDYWQFQAKKGERLALEFRARREGSFLNPLVFVIDSKGKELQRIAERGEFAAPEEGVFRLRIEEEFGPRGGPRYAYRLRVAKPDIAEVPDFRLRLPRPSITLPRGGKAEIEIALERLGGFAQGVQVVFAPLPDGVSVSETEFAPGKNTAKVTFQASAKAKVVGAKVTVRGVAEIDGFRVTRTAAYPMRDDPFAIDTLLVAVAMPTPFKLSGTYTLPFALRGTTHYRRLNLQRGDFEGPVRVRMADVQIRHQQGTWGREIVIPTGQTEFDYPLEVSLWAAVGLTSRSVVMAYADVEDFDGTKHTVGFRSILTPEQVMIQPNSGPIGISLERPAVTAIVGTPVDVVVRVKRDDTFSLPVILELDLPEHMKGISAAPVTVPVGTSEATLKVQFGSSAGPFNMVVPIRATARLTEDVMVRGRPLRKGDDVYAETSIRFVEPRRPRS